MNLELSIRFPSIVPEAVCKLYLTTFSLFFLSFDHFFSHCRLGCHSNYMISISDLPSL